MKQKFFGLLEELFIGAKVEGDTGISNLLNLKGQYFAKFQKELENKLDNLDEAVYDRLYTFFKNYFNESGSLFFANTPKWEKRYARVSNKDVELFYKTKELYYVKSQKVYESLEIEIDEVKFYFDASLLGKRIGNEKKEVEFLFSDIQKDKFIFLVRYKTTQKYDILKEITQLDTPKKARIEILNNLEKYKDRIIFEKNYVYEKLDYFKNKKGNIPDIFEMVVKKIDKKESLFKKVEIILTLKDVKKIVQLIGVDEKILEKAFKIYNKQTKIDYFIHKDARSFLREQFNLWMYDYLANDLDTIFDENSLREIQNIKKIAYELIDKIAEFEDELKRVWLKPRFALNSNYVITKDRLKKYGVLDKFLSHDGIDEQIKEWKELKLVDENFDISQIEDEKYNFLPFDTKFFKDVEIELLEKIDNLDDELDGRLIKSENFQALNTLLNKYQNSIQTIYIDPPFNTGKDFDYIDKFQDSTWLTLMENRLQLARELLNKRGSLFLHLDYRANHYGRILLDDIFGKENFVNEIVWAYTGPSKQQNNFPKKHDNIYWYAKNKNKKISNLDLIRIPYKNLNEGGSGFGEGLDKKSNKEYLKRGKIVEDWWIDISPTDRLIKELVGFQTQKPEKLLERILKSASNNSDLILDFFLGSGTTTATAHKLNRKWIGIEMGEHFETIILPRMKKVLAGEIVGISKELEKKGELKKGGFFKYYQLEQFEDILQKAVYKESLEVSPKMSYATDIDFENEKLFYVFEKLYKNVDIAETISNLLGSKIVKIEKDRVILENREIDLNELTFENYPELKPLIYWS